MRESKYNYQSFGTRSCWRTVAIAVYPALNVISISLRPGNQLAFRPNLAIVPKGWTLDSYKQLFTRAAVSSSLASETRLSWRWA